MAQARGHRDQSPEPDYNPFSISDSSLNGTRRALIRLIEITSGQQNLEQKYREFRVRSAAGGSFWNEAVRLSRTR